MQLNKPAIDVLLAAPTGCALAAFKLSPLGFFSTCEHTSVSMFSLLVTVPWRLLLFECRSLECGHCLVNPPSLLRRGRSLFLSENRLVASFAPVLLEGGQSLGCPGRQVWSSVLCCTRCLSRVRFRKCRKRIPGTLQCNTIVKVNDVSRLQSHPAFTTITTDVLHVSRLQP